MLGVDSNTIRSVSMHQSNDSILAYISELSDRRSRKEGVGILQGRLRSIYLGDDVHDDSLESLSELQVDLCSLMRSIGDGNSSVYDDDANGFVHFDSDGETCFKRRGGKLRQISVEWRAVQDSNPRLRIRNPEGYPGYPNSPRISC